MEVLVDCRTESRLTEITSRGLSTWESFLTTRFRGSWSAVSVLCVRVWWGWRGRGEIENCGGQVQTLGRFEQMCRSSFKACERHERELYNTSA